MEELLGRRVPWSAEAEQAVLGSCLIDPSCLPDVMTAVRGADFYLPQNREIFETIFSMFTFAKPIDPVTVLDEMKVRGVYHDESSQQYIRELMRLTPTAANVLKYAAIVRDQALLRNVITVCEETVEAASSGAGEAGDVLDLCEKKIYALRQDRVVGGLMISPRERIVLIEVEDTWIVVGIVPGQIKTLHTLPKGELPPPVAGDGTFAQWLKQIAERNKHER